TRLAVVRSLDAHELPPSDAGAAASSARATRNITDSFRAGASTCTPTGRPCAPAPKGTLIAGCPAGVDGIVQTSDKYIASGSAVLLPSSNATVGDVGERSTSNVS